MATNSKETNPYLTFEDADLTDDFGFSFGSEDEIAAQALAPASDEITDLKLQAVRKIYLPLLNNLAKNSDQPIIKWPDRGPVLKKQIDKLTSLTEPAFK